MKVLHVEAGMHLYGGALQVVFLLRGRQGVTPTPAGRPCASVATAFISTSSSTGLDGLSKNTSFAGLANAVSHAAISVPSISSVTIPQRGKILVKIA